MASLFSGSNVGAFLIWAVLIGLGWLGVRMLRQSGAARLRAIADGLKDAGAVVTALEPPASGFSGGRLRFELGSYRGHVAIEWWVRSTLRLSFHLDAAARPGVWIRRPSALDGVARALGLRRVVKLGGADVSIATRARPATVEKLLAAPDTARLVHELVDASTFLEFVGGGHELAVGPDGLTVVKFVSSAWAFDARVVPRILERLEALDRTLPRFEVAEVAPLLPSSPMIVSTFAPIYLLFPVIGLLSLVPRHTVDPASVNMMLSIALVPGILALVLAWRRYRGRPYALRQLFFTGIGLAPAVLFLTFVVLGASNAALDTSPAVTHRVRVLDHYKGNTHTVWVESWTPGVPREKLLVPKSMPAVAVGDTLSVDVRKGAFGWEWVPSVRKEAAVASPR